MLSLLLLSCAASAAPQEPVLRPQPWRLLGPYGSARAPQTTGRLGPQEALDEMAVNSPWPALLQDWKSGSGAPLRWRAVQQPAVFPAGAGPGVDSVLDVGVIDLLEQFPQLAGLSGERKRNVAFLYRPLFVAEATKVPVQLGSDDGIRVWLNGEEVHRVDRERVLDRRAATVELELEAGLNHLLVKLARKEGAWRFALRLAPTRATAAAVNDAVERGVEYLLARQMADGGWPEYPGHPLGIAGIGVYTLLKSGLPRDHPAVQRGLHKVRSTVAGDTYSVALQAMAIGAAGFDEDLLFLEELAATLVDWQLSNGLWAYPAGGGDLSNTQYAALGLRAAAQRGIEIEAKVWTSLARGTLSCSTNHGQFAYRPTNGGGAGGASMTAAGVGTLAICRAMLAERNFGDLNADMDHAVERGLRELGRQCTLHDGLQPSNWSYYCVYGYERAGGLTGSETFDGHPWYPEGALQLLDQQHHNGGWVESGGDLMTCYALLFLRRATGRGAVTAAGAGHGEEADDGRFLRSDPTAGALVLRVSLQAPTHVWIDATSPAFDSLRKVVYWVQPPDGTWQRLEEVEGHRFSARVAFDEVGIWQVRASGFLTDGTTVASGIVEIDRSGDPAAFGGAPTITARELARLMRSGAPRPEPTASSAADQASPHGLIDLRLDSGWRCTADDLKPWFEVSFRVPRKLERLRLAPAVLPKKAALPAPSASRLRLVFDDGSSRLVPMPAGVGEVLDLALDPPVRTKTLRVEILGVRGGVLGEASVGFSELLLD